MRVWRRPLASRSELALSDAVLDEASCRVEWRCLGGNHACFKPKWMGNVGAGISNTVVHVLGQIVSRMKNASADQGVWVELIRSF
jgi:hypothetical protein